MFVLNCNQSCEMASDLPKRTSELSSAGRPAVAAALGLDERGSSKSQDDKGAGKVHVVGVFGVGIVDGWTWSRSGGL